MTLSYPGVYMQEVSSGVRPIQAAGTSTAAFLGVAERGPIGEVMRIFNFTEFQTTYGGFLRNHYLAHAVFQFFNNGGSQCYVGRVARDPKIADITIEDRGSPAADALTLSAVSPGAWGNTLQVSINSGSARDPDNTFNLEVYESVPDQDQRLLEKFDGLSMNPASPSYVATVVNGMSRYIRVAPNLANSNQIAAYIEGTPVIRPGDLQRKLRISMHGDGFQEIDLTAALSGEDVSVLENIRAKLEDVIQGLVPLRASTPAAAYSGATVTLTGTPADRLRITSGEVDANSTVEIRPAQDTAENAAGALGLSRGARRVDGSSDMRPPDTAQGMYYLLGDAPVTGPVSAVTEGADGSTLQDLHYIDALSMLDTIRDVSLIAIPGVGSETVADAGMNYCLNIRPLSDCFFIADMASHDDTLTEAEMWRDEVDAPNSYGGAYFPWLKMLDPNGGSEPIPVPPSGYVAGIYARNDARRGVWKTPAGVQASVAGTVGLVTELTDEQQGVLNVHPKSVCVIRRFPGSGIVIWGGRTLSSDPEYRYISPRRTAIFLR
ncbi:MAG: phage tail sheath subtilisin-like domain-containing protein, partial [Pseudonocardiaceae bacterium]